MTAPRLIRLVPTGEVFLGTELVEPEEVRPLTDKQLEEMWEADKTSADDCASLYYFKLVVRAAEKAHGIGRRLDA